MLEQTHWNKSVQIKIVKKYLSNKIVKATFKNIVQLIEIILTLI